jgi:tyrosine-protein kinase Etk/Wzc
MPTLAAPRAQVHAEAQTPPRQDDIDLRALLGTVHEHRWTVLGFAAAFACAALLYSTLASPVYEANAVIQVGQVVPAADDVAKMLDASASRASTEIPLLTSRSVVDGAVKDLGLLTEVAPERFPVIGGWLARRFRAANPGEVAGPWLGMPQYDWGGSELSIGRFDVPAQLLDQPLQLVVGEGGAYRVLGDDGDTLLSGRAGSLATGRGIAMFVKGIRANPGTRFDVVRHAPLTTVSLIQSNLVATEQGKDSGIISLTYRSTDPAAATALLDKITRGYLEKNVQRNTAEANSSLQVVQRQLPRAKKDLDNASAALNAYQSKTGAIDTNLQAGSLLNETATLETSIQQLRMQRVDADQRFAPGHPVMKALDSQLAILEGRKATLARKLAQLPASQQELPRLSRDVQEAEQAYASLLHQSQQLEAVREAAIGDARLIDPAAVDVSRPVWPLRLLLVPGAVLLGVVVGLAFVFLRQLLRRAIEDETEIEELGLPVFASIPWSRAGRAAPTRRLARDTRAPALLLANRPREVAVEALRGLRTCLDATRFEAPNNVLLVTSAWTGSGKSFVSANLATVIANAGQEVLLVDGDMRGGELHASLSSGVGPGLSELIRGDTTIEDAVRPVPGVQRLMFIPRGALPPNPSELLMHERFVKLLGELGERYGTVVIDAPPALAFTDATLIGKHAGTTLLVVRFGVDQPRDVAAVWQRLAQGRATVRGAIFNAVDRPRRRDETDTRYNYPLAQA